MVVAQFHNRCTSYYVAINRNTLVLQKFNSILAKITHVPIRSNCKLIIAKSILDPSDLKI